MRKLGSFLLACVLTFSLCMTGARTANAGTKEVVLRFVVASDLHLTENANDSHAKRLEGMFQSAYAYAQGQTYKTLDAVVLVGDLICLGEPEEYAALKAVLERSNLKEETEVLTLMGNHEWWRYTNNGQMDKGSVSYLNGIETIDSIEEKTLNWSKTIKGYSFIGMSPLSDESYGTENLQWMAEEIAQSVHRDDAKPVFTFQHHPIKGTVMGSNSSGTTQAESGRMDAVYAPYRQVINFSGHSHISINTPTAINQTTYTQYTTGTMATLGSDGNATYPGILPGRDNVAQYTIVEVYEDHTVRMLPYDQYAGKWFTSLNGDGSQLVYEIDVNHPKQWLYKADTRTDRYHAPQFKNGVAVQVGEVGTEMATITFGQAQDDYGVYGYDIVAADGKGAELAYRIYSEWYFQPMPQNLTYQLTDLQPETAYTVSVYPIDFFGNKGNPILTALQTEAAEVEEEEIVYDPEAYTDNLLAIGDCESQKSTDWGIFARAEYTTEYVHSGNYALKLAHNGNTAQVRVNFRNIIPGETYRISAWIYVEEGAPDLNVQRGLTVAIESPWKTLEQSYDVARIQKGAWVRYAFDFRAPDKANIIQLDFYTADAGTWFYLDDIEIYRICMHRHLRYTEEKQVCIGRGNKEYWSCRTCGTLFGDENLTQELTLEDTYLQEHDRSYVPKKDATVLQTGYQAHWLCSCGKRYESDASSEPLSASQLVIAKKDITVPLTSLKKVTPKKKGLAIKWKKKSDVTGYEIEVARKKNFKKVAKKAIVKGAGKSSKILKGLKSGKKYYIRVRTYKVIEGKKFVSSWKVYKKAIKTK